VISPDAQGQGAQRRLAGLVAAPAKVRGCVTTSAQTSLAALATADAGLGLVAYEMTRLAEAAGGVLTPGHPLTPDG
jgi:hypothetical protein